MFDIVHSCKCTTFTSTIHVGLVRQECMLASLSACVQGKVLLAACASLTVNNPLAH